MKEQLLEDALNDLDRFNADAQAAPPVQTALGTAAASDSSTRVDDIQQEVGLLQERNQEIQAEATHLQEELVSSQRKLAEQEEVTRLVTEENERQSERLADEVARSRRYQGQLNESQHQSEIMRQRVEESESAVRRMREENMATSEVFMRQIRKLREENEQKQDEIRNRDDELETKDRQINQLHEEVTNLQQTNEIQRTTSDTTISTLRRDTQRLVRARDETRQILHQYDSVLDIPDDDLQITGPRLGGGATGGKIYR